MTPPHRRWLIPTSDPDESTFLADLLRRETVGGAIALAAAAVALIWANVDHHGYHALVATRLGPFDLAHWGSDGALTLFFFVAGLELKRELVLGSLRRPADAAVPIAAACGGVAVPALLFLVVNHATGDARGWAIPSATDIAFALAVLAVVGAHLPAPLRTFLLTLAIVDDLIVIAIIAVAYTGTIHGRALAVAGLAMATYAVGQLLRVRHPLFYVVLGVVAWWFMHESGVHATIAGCVLGLLTRVRPDDGERRSPAERLERLLTPWSSGAAVPFFAFVSAGVVVSARGFDSPVAIGVVVGLVLGKPLGVLLGTGLVTRFTRAELNADLGWRDLFGLALLTGVGFTVSLLVSELSYDDHRSDVAKSAVLLGSVISSALAAVVLGRRSRAIRRDGAVGSE